MASLGTCPKLRAEQQIIRLISGQAVLFQMKATVMELGLQEK